MHPSSASRAFTNGLTVWSQCLRRSSLLAYSAAHTNSHIRAFSASATALNSSSNSPDSNTIRSNNTSRLTTSVTTNVSAPASSQAVRSVHGSQKQSLASVAPEAMVLPSKTAPLTPLIPLSSQNPSSHLPSPISHPTIVAREPEFSPAFLSFASGERFAATSFGAPLAKIPDISGEVVFTTAVVGYPESMTDPSYRGQILVFTQPLVGNYGVPPPDRDQYGLLKHFESDAIQVQAIVVNDYATKYSHWNAVESLGQWCARHNVAAICGVDTRAIVHLLRDRGSTLGRIDLATSKSSDTAKAGAASPVSDTLPVLDYTKRNFVAEISTRNRQIYNQNASLKIALVDCGVKHNIIRSLTTRGLQVHVLPWDHSFADDSIHYDGIFLSNGPGNPAHLGPTVQNLKRFMAQPQSAKIPIFGICMGNQILGMAAGFDTYKLKYGNRGHNQPAVNVRDGTCVITSQNHGYALDDSKPVANWATYFRNANDGSNEGIRHTQYPWSSVQFHPEAMGGPQDTDYLFDQFYQDVVSFANKA